MGKAVLAVWDKDQVRDIVITWDKHHDEDARVAVPKPLRARWKVAARLIAEEATQENKGMVEPYPTMPIFVPVKHLKRSATCAYAIARLLFAPEIGWRVPPPFPKEDDIDPKAEQ
jgi:hypothetical protein